MADLLVVEDEPRMRGLLERALTAEGHRVLAVGDGISALGVLRAQHVDVAAIDVALPGMSGIELCRFVRREGLPVAIVLVTARDGVDDRIVGLDAGADDYLVKPFAMGELAARVRALLRRAGPAAVQIQVGDLVVDPLAVRATVGDRVVPLSVKEFGLVRVLASASGRPVDRATVLAEVWGDADRFDRAIVDQYVSYARRKLELTGSRVRIETIRGVGYRLVGDAP